MLIVLRTNYDTERTQELTSPKKGEKAVCGYNPGRSVLSSFDVVLMSCKVNFHVVRSALQ